MNILSIDSTTKKLGVAVSRDKKLLSEMISSSSIKHMVKVMDLIDGALSRARLKLGDIDVFGVNIGPGDFTGTRIGVSVIKILSWLEERPAFGINSLDVFSLTIGIKNANLILRCLNKNIPVLLVPCLDVRRGEIYFALYSMKPEADSKNGYMARVRIRGKTYDISREGKEFIINAKDLKAVLDGLFNGSTLKIPESKVEFKSPAVVIGGNCFRSYGKVLKDIIGGNENFYSGIKNIYPEPEYLNTCVYYSKLRGEKTTNLVPVYIREFVPFGGKKGSV